MSDPNPTQYGPYSDTHIALYAKIALWLRDSTGQFTTGSRASSPQVFANTSASSLTGLIGGSIVSDGSANAYIANASGVPKKILKAGDAFTFADNVGAIFGDGSDITILWDATNLVVSQAAADSSILWGASGAGINHTFYGDTAGRDLLWDQSLDSLIFADSAVLGIGSGAGAGADITFSWDGTRLNVNQLTANSEIRWGVDGAGLDQRWYGDTASAAMVFDQSLDALTFEGVASIRGIRTSSTTAAVITGTTVLTLADSGGVFSVSQASAYDIDLPSPTSGPGCRYNFYLTGPAANNVTITVAGGAATFVGTIVNDVTSVIAATGSTLTFASGTAALGDNIEITSISTGLYLVRAVTSAAGGITIT